MSGAEGLRCPAGRPDRDGPEVCHRFVSPPGHPPGPAPAGAAV